MIQRPFAACIPIQDCLIWKLPFHQPDMVPFHFFPTSILDSPSIIMPPGAGTKSFFRSINQPHILIAHVPQFMCEDYGTFLQGDKGIRL